MLRKLLAVAALAVVVAAAAVQAADPLPSWNDAGARAAILDFVAAVSDPASPDFVPVAARIAVFDNDGTSWCERPGYGPTRFQVSLLRSLVDRGQVDRDAMPFRAWLADDRDALREFGWNEAYRQMNAQFAGMPVSAYRDSVRAFLGRERHERFGVPLTDLYYRPMRELKAFLEAHGFQVWVVTGGAQDFVRAYLEEAFGVPPERVIGTWTTPVYEAHDDGRVTMVRGAEQVSNGHEHKPAHIELRIGRRPILAVGNNDNDEPMCRWTLGGERRALALWIHHDDPDREYAYDRGAERMAGLCRDHAAAHEVSMRRDWRRVFDHEAP
ncbi:MAG: HAD family hydrolase [Candidatus Krumholzibacteriia bacterium]